MTPYVHNTDYLIILKACKQTKFTQAVITSHGALATAAG